jgi:hypothetical protein
MIDEDLLKTIPFHLRQKNNQNKFLSRCKKPQFVSAVGALVLYVSKKYYF